MNTRIRRFMINLFATIVVIAVAYGLPLIVFALVALLAYRIMTMR